MSMQDMAGGTSTIPVSEAMPVAVQDKLEGTSSASLSSFEGDEPTEEDKATLRHVSDKLPWSTFLVAAIELCERFTYYGLSGPFQNYIQNPYNPIHKPGEIPGAIGMRNTCLSRLSVADKVTGLGQTGATGLVDFFQFWCYVTPILGAV